MTLPTNDSFGEYGWMEILAGGEAYEGVRAIDGAPAEDMTSDRIASVHAFYAEDGDEGYGSRDVALLAELTDGTWATCVAWCDTTGWDCQSGANWRVAPTRELAISNGLDKYARARLDLSLPGEVSA